MSKQNSSRLTPNLWAVPLAILLLALGVRCGTVYYWQSKAEVEQRAFRLGDSHSYWILAGHIARGESYEYGSSDSKIFRAPLYPIFLAPFTLINDESLGIWVARLAGSLMGTAAVWIVFLLGWRMGGYAAGCWAGVLAAVYPGAIGMSIVILSEVIFCPLMLLNILAWQSAFASKSNSSLLRWASVAGVAAGLGILARPSWLLFAPALAALGLLFGPRRSKHLVVFLVSLATCSLAMSPWWIRNAIITGRFVPTTLQVGPSLYDGLHAGATGASDEGMSFSVEHANKLAEEDRLGNLGPESEIADGDVFEYRLNQRMTRLALEWSLENPTSVLWLAGVKLTRVWSLWPDGKEVGSTGLRLALTGACLGVLILALWASRRLATQHGWLAMVCWMPTFYFTVLHIIFVGSIRYREPAILVATVLAGCAIASILHSRREIHGS